MTPQIEETLTYLELRYPDFSDLLDATADWPEGIDILLDYFLDTAKETDIRKQIAELMVRQGRQL